MDETQEIFDRHKSIVHWIPANPSEAEQIGIDFFTTDDDAIEGDGGAILTCVTSGTAYSDTSPFDDANPYVNYVLLRHDLEFNPRFGNETSKPPSRTLNWPEVQGAQFCANYRVRVRALNAQGQKVLREGDPMPLDVLEDPWEDGFTDTSALILPNSQPQNMAQLVTHSGSESTVESGSLSAGFFGPAPTGGGSISRGVTMTTSVSYSTPTMESQDLSTDNHVLNKLFVVHPNVSTIDDWNDPSKNPGAFSFGTEIAEIFAVPDDMHGIRDKKTTFREFEISISVSIMIGKTPLIDGTVTTLAPAKWWRVPDGGKHLEKDVTLPTMATVSNTIRHIIKVPAPPLPPGVAGLDYPNPYNDPSRPKIGAGNGDGGLNGDNGDGDG